MHNATAFNSQLSGCQRLCVAVQQTGTLSKLMSVECQTRTLAIHFMFTLSGAIRQPVDMSLALQHWHLFLAVCSVSFIGILLPMTNATYAQRF